jgi:hypothetical protein
MSAEVDAGRQLLEGREVGLCLFERQGGLRLAGTDDA